MSAELPKEAQEYLRRLRHALAALPQAEREEVLAEIESHLVERQGGGGASAALLEGFDAPEEYAAQFVSQRAVADALARGGGFALGASLLVGRVSSLLSYLAVIPLWGLQVIGYVLLVLAALKPLFPASVGLFVGEGTFALGWYAGPPDAHEILGWWAMPAFLLASALMLWTSNRALRALARRRLRRPLA
jgi:uncharacterized membrane protein